MSEETTVENVLSARIDSLKHSINLLHQAWADNIEKAYWKSDTTEIKRIVDAMREPLQ